jgi:hypothetical protein
MGRRGGAVRDALLPRVGNEKLPIAPGRFEAWSEKTGRNERLSLFGVAHTPEFCLSRGP